MDYTIEVAVRFWAAPNELGEEYLGCDDSLGVPPTSASDGDPVNTATGNFYEHRVDVPAPGGAYGMQWSRTYNSQDHDTATDPETGQPGLLGPGWSTPLDTSLREGANGLEFRGPDGRRVHFAELTSSSWEVPEELFASVSEDTGAGTRTLTFVGGEEWVFDLDGRLQSMESPWGDTVTVNRDSTTQVPESMVSATPGGAGYTTTFVDGGDDGLIDQVVGADGAKVDYVYDDGVLESASKPYLGSDEHGADHFTYHPTSAMLTDIDSEVDPNLGSPTTVTRVHNVYDGFGRVESQTAPGGNVTTFVYGVLDGDRREVTVTHDDGLSSETAHFFYDGNGDLREVDDPFDQQSALVWNRDQLETFADPDGGLTDPTFDDTGRLESLDLAHPDIPNTTSGAVTTTYCGTAGSGDPRIASVTDAAGVKTTYFYGDSGTGPCAAGEFVPSQVTTAADTAEAATTIIESDHGLITSTTDADDVTTTYQWDAGRRLLLASTVDEDTGSGGVQTTFYGYDGAGRLQVVRTPLGNETWTTYDGAGRVRSEVGTVHVAARDCDPLPCDFGSTPPSGPTTTYTYWLDGSLRTREDPEDNLWSYQRSYDTVDDTGWTDTEVQPDDDAFSSTGQRSSDLSGSPKS